MTLKEIKTALSEGKKVYLSNISYEVIQGRTGEYLIKHGNGHCIGLTWADETTMNGKEEDFFTI